MQTDEGTRNGTATITIEDGLQKGEIVRLQYDPKELAIDKAVPWTKQERSAADAPIMEFTSAEPMTLSCELMFDTFERKLSVRDAYVEPLVRLCLVDPKLKRPPLVSFTYAGASFVGVVTKVATKYTLFLANGTPVRAAVTFTMTEAQAAQSQGERDPQRAEKKARVNGTVVQAGTAGRADNLAAQSGKTTAAGTPDHRALASANHWDDLGRARRGTAVKMS